VVSGYAPAPGRLVLFLEGGYELDALRRSVAATLGALVGSPEPAEAVSSGGPGTEQLEAVASRRRESLDQMT
jgi:acetoin utilization deacetylase AcuC-like enzyme